ncbi:hypothetical protein ACVOMT_22480 [Sphingomonas panni]
MSDDPRNQLSQARTFIEKATAISAWMKPEHHDDAQQRAVAAPAGPRGDRVEDVDDILAAPIVNTSPTIAASRP